MVDMPIQMTTRMIQTVISVIPNYAQRKKQTFILRKTGTRRFLWDRQVERHNL